jgi:hypothetical protein
MRDLPSVRMMLARLLPFQFCAAGVGHWFGRALKILGASVRALRAKSLVLV